MSHAKEQPLVRLLCQHQLLDEQILLDASRAAHEQQIPLASWLVRQNLLTADALAMLMSRTFGLTIDDLEHWQNRPAISETDEKLIGKYHALPLQKTEQQLWLAMSDLTQADCINAFGFHTRLQIKPVLVRQDQLSALLDGLLISTPVHLDVEIGDEQEPDDETLLDTPTVKFVNKTLLDAIKLKASDIHFEPYEKQYRIRYRIDGMMQVMTTLPTAHAHKIAARLKVMARLDIAERRKPQDGRIRLPINEQKSVDFRVSTLPTLFGEKLVLRILDSSQAVLNLDELGMNAVQKSLFLHAINKPQGMIIITGPTGSGKTISLYTALSLLNQSDRNIMSAEDPVEIYLDGINQVAINPKIGLDFAEVLRAFLRQDPDIIMVGEIRDIETAQIAIKASQTGHLVLSTLHTNTASQSITRLQNMGIANFLLASSVSLLVAQRLARRLCDHCKTPANLPTQSLVEAGFSPSQIGQRPTIYQAVGCHRCKDGYRGRVGVFEMMPITPAIAKMIMQNTDDKQLDEHNQDCGNQTLRQSAIEKVIAGIIDLPELYRISHD